MLSLSPDQAGAAGTITWYRPADSKADRTTALALDRDGRQQLPLSGLMAGRWTVQVRWTARGRDYYYEQAVQLP